MPKDLADGETAHVQGSAATPYELKNTGGVYSCTCPAWRNQSKPIERRTCKHLKSLRGEAAEATRVGSESAGAGGNSKSSRSPTSSRDASDNTKAAPALLLAQPWDQIQDLTGWWMSEKLDGVRALWDGQRFISRLGNEYHAPAWFHRELGAEPLDGELWIGRGQFQRTVSVVRRQDRSELWREVRYVIFDAPAIDKPFEQRIDALKQRFAKGAEWARVLEHEVCESLTHVRSRLRDIEALGGEGLMMRQPGSRYVRSRSSTLLKIKSFHDAEARVIGHLPGTGKHKGRLGALRVVLSDGTEFSVGTGFSDAERQAPPAIGALITFRYQELTDGGVPRFPSYVGERIDAAAPSHLAKPRATSPSKAPKNSSAPKSAQPAAASSSSQPIRRFEFSDGTSNKFWEVEIQGSSHTVRYGRMGSAGRELTKQFESPSQAQKDAEKLIAEKLGKGYRER